MSRFDVILLTEEKYENPSKKDVYIENILKEDEIIQAALEKKGLSSIRWSWDKKGVDWSDGKLLLFRTTWDYHHRRKEFFSWLEKTAYKSHFVNPINTVKWNVDKHYLVELESKGVNIAKTKIFEKGDRRDLMKDFKSFNAEEVVMKPLISAGGRHTYRIRNETISANEEIFSSLLNDEAIMLQEFQKDILINGELSLIFFGNNYSHAILKKAKPGDFRVQDDFGGSVHDYTASKKEIDFARFTIEKIEPTPVYSRVDIFKDNDGNLALAELELIEPELWFRNKPKAAELLIDEIVKLL